MFESKMLYSSDDNNDYNLAVKYDNGFTIAKKKVLILVQTVDGRDLAKRELLSDKTTKTLLVNCIKEARNYARKYNKNSTNSVEFAVASFNNKKHLHLSTAAKREAEKEFAIRSHRLIKKIKPTHVLISGDEAMRSMFPEVQHSNYKRGLVHNLKVDEQEIKVVSTLDLYRLIEKGGLNANLLGFWYRHLGNLMLGKHPQDLSHVRADPYYVDTIEKFDKFLYVLNKSSIVAIDTETANLSVLSNAIYTIQFATDLNPLLGYVVPIDHPMTPFNATEIAYIKLCLKHYFSIKEGVTKTVAISYLNKEVKQTFTSPKETVYFNGAFDLRVIRQALKIPIIWHRVWEITAGEHLLDENTAALSLATGTKAGGLLAIYCSYGNDKYLLESSFGKADRSNVANVNPTNADFLSYAATDVVSILHLRIKQIHRAKYEDFVNKDYQPIFITHMLYQMSDTVHQLSHLKEDGSFLDKKYLKYLLSPESPLRAELKIAGMQLKEYKEVQAANKLLLSNAGLKSKGLFGAVKATTANWMFRIKTAHLSVLFYDVMGLTPVSQTKGGANAVDKEFVAEYKDTHAVVATYAEYGVIAKLMSTYVKGWYKKLNSDSDSILDSHLRPDYSFFGVVTGRLASRNPSLQTIPQRSKAAKLIKRMFIAKTGYLPIRYDYSAMEVRGWSWVSKDKVLADSFKVGQKLRQEYIVNPTQEIAKKVDASDLHVINSKKIFGDPNNLINKKHKLRQACKRVVFGLIYGMSSKTLGEGTKEGDIEDIKNNIKVLRLEFKALTQ